MGSPRWYWLGKDVQAAECPICHTLTDAEELLDNSGLCMRCDNEQQEVMTDNRTIEKEEKEDDGE